MIVDQVAGTSLEASLNHLAGKESRARAGSIFIPGQNRSIEEGVIVLNMDVMLGERQRGILGFVRTCELVFVHQCSPRTGCPTT